MCFGGTPKYESSPAPAVTPAPTPAPAPLPSPTPTTVEATISAQERRKKIQAVQYGMMSTIKTSPQGITGTGANLNATDATGRKTTLGS